MQKTYYVGAAYENYGTGKLGNVNESVTYMDVTVDSTLVYPGIVTAEMRYETLPIASYIVDVTDKCIFDWSNVNTHFVGYYYPKISYTYGQKNYSIPITVHVVPPQYGWNTVWEGSVSTSTIGPSHSHRWINPFWSASGKIRFTFSITYTGSDSLSYYDFSTQSWSTTPITSPVVIDVPRPTSNQYTTLLGFRAFNTLSELWDVYVSLIYRYDSFDKKYYLHLINNEDSNFELTITKIEQYFEDPNA